VARAYAQMLQKSLAPVAAPGSGSAAPDDQFKLAVQVLGFGPRFLLRVQLESGCARPRADLELGFGLDTRLYRAARASLALPLVLPGVHYCFENRLWALSDKGQADVVKVFLFKEARPDPILTAIVAMPVSEPPLV